LKAAGLLTLDLDRLTQEAEAARAVLTNGAGRRARDRARGQLARLERRAARLRASLEAAERRLEELAGDRRRPTPDELLDRAHAEMRKAHEEELARGRDG